MNLSEVDIWSGWPLLSLGERPDGGEKVRYYKRLKSIRDTQLKVLQLIGDLDPALVIGTPDRKSTRLNSSHGYNSYAVFCLKKKKHRRLCVYTKARDLLA